LSVIAPLQKPVEFEDVVVVRDCILLYQQFLSDCMALLSLRPVVNNCLIYCAQFLIPEQWNIALPVHVTQKYSRHLWCLFYALWTWI